MTNGPEPAGEQQGDFAHLPGRPGAQEYGPEGRKVDQGFQADRSVLDTSRTSPTRLEYANPDGTRTTALSPAPVRFQDTDGAWRNYDYGLQRAIDSADGGKGVAAVEQNIVTSPDDLVARATDIPLVFPADPAAGAARFGTPAGVFTFLMPDGLGADVTRAERPAESSSATEFVSKAEGTTLVLSQGIGGFEESLIVERPDGPSSYERQVLVPAGIKAVQTKLGVDFVDGDGAVVLSFGRGFGVDAAEDQVAVSTDLVGQDGEVVGIRVSVPEKWFGAAG